MLKLFKNFVQLKKYYHLYNNTDRMQLENLVVTYRILEKKRCEYIPQDLHNRLVNRRRRVVEDDRGIREYQIKKLCKVNNEEDMRKTKGGIEPLWRNKMLVCGD